MYKIAEERFQELYKHYAGSTEQIDEYSSYLKSIMEMEQNCLKFRKNFKQTNWYC